MESQRTFPDKVTEILLKSLVTLGLTRRIWAVYRKNNRLLFSFKHELILVWFNMGREFSLKKIFFLNEAKYGYFEYLVEYPIWVSIKRFSDYK